LQNANLLKYLDPEHSSFFILRCNYSGLPLSAGAKKRAVTIMVAPLQPKQRVRSESAAGTGVPTA
jgi:hypothetical protein